MASKSLVTYPLHADIHAFEIPNISVKDNVHLSKKFELECITGGSPGTWEVELKLSKDLPFENFKIYAKLKRIDDERNVLNAFLSISLVNIQGKMCPHSYSMDHAFTGQETESKLFGVDEHYKCLFVNESLHLDALVVEIKLVVAGCQARHKGHDLQVATIAFNDCKTESGDGAMFARL